MTKVLELVTAPAKEPVTLSELKAQARIDDVNEDALLLEYITAAREHAEDILNRSLITRTYRKYLDRWSGRRIELDRPPLVAVSSVKYDDESDVEQTFASSNYQVVANNLPPYLELKPDIVWPTITDTTKRDRIRVEYTAGYGSDPTDVPLKIRQAIRAIATAMYEHRSPVIVGTGATELEGMANALLWPERLVPL